MSSLAPQDLDRRNALICHALVFTGFLFPLGNIVWPLVWWIIKRKKSSFVDHHGKEVVNFQITMSMAGIICLVLAQIVIGFVLILPLIVVSCALTIRAMFRTKGGELHRYPLSVRLIV